MNRFGFTESGARPAISHHNATQYRPASLESEIIVPAAMAAVSGVLAVVGWLWLWWQWPDSWPIQPPLQCAVPLFLVTAAAVWAWRMRHHDDVLISGTERAHHRPVHLPTTEEKRYTTFLQVNQGKTDDEDKLTHVAGLSLPVSDDVLASFARAALAGSSLGERAWAGPGKPMTSGDGGTYRQVKRMLLHSNPPLVYFTAVGGKRQLAPTDEGRKVFQQFIELYDQGQGDDDEEGE